MASSRTQVGPLISLDLAPYNSGPGPVIGFFLATLVCVDALGGDKFRSRWELQLMHLSVHPHNSKGLCLGLRVQDPFVSLSF